MVVLNYHGQLLRVRFVWRSIFAIRISFLFWTVIYVEQIESLIATID